MLYHLSLKTSHKNGIFTKNRNFLISVTHVLASLDGPDSWDMCHLSGRIHFLYQRFPGAVRYNEQIHLASVFMFFSAFVPRNHTFIITY